ncbi:MAG: DUF5329 family protein [Fluviicola sp.]|nr:DUF5329 family protein [Fluviicola sp.]
MQFRFIVLTILTVTFFVSSCSKSGLEIEEDALLKITQRGSIEIPGDEGEVTLSVSDITGGACTVSVQGMIDGLGVYFFDQSLSEGQAGTFQYHDSYYEIKIDHFEEHLLHDDFAFIRLRTISEEESKRREKTMESPETQSEPSTADDSKAIQPYLTQLKKSNLQFLFGDEVWDGRFTASHLEAKFILLHESSVDAKKDFRNMVVTASITSDKAYWVVTEKKDTVLLVDWIKW